MCIFALDSPSVRFHAKVIYSLDSEYTCFKTSVDRFAAQSGRVLYRLPFTELLLLVHFVPASEQIHLLSA